MLNYLVCLWLAFRKYGQKCMLVFIQPKSFGSFKIIGSFKIPVIYTSVEKILSN